MTCGLSMTGAGGWAEAGVAAAVVAEADSGAGDDTDTEGCIGVCSVA